MGSRNGQSIQSFICGPAPFIAVVRDALSEVGVPRECIHLEVFESLSGDPFGEESIDADVGDTDADAAEAQIELDGEEYTLRWPRSRNLVDTMLAAGIEVPVPLAKATADRALPR